jgi:hypothetical protein
MSDVPQADLPFKRRTKDCKHPNQGYAENEEHQVKYWVGHGINILI